jgi:beta-glucanase (GH16 family)
MKSYGESEMMNPNAKAGVIRSLRLRHVVVVAGCLFIAVSTLAEQTASLASLEAQQPSWAGYKLVWSDEFNKEGKPDGRNWIYEEGFVRNRELQWYQSDNARCDKGLLIIEAMRQRKKNPCYRPDSRRWNLSRKYADYTSASLMTRGLHNWKFGRFEMRGRIDTRPGMWPAFWTLGSARPWPGCGEIDIMEYYRGMLLANAAWASERRRVAVWDDSRIPLAQFKDPDWSRKFHVWRMDWDADSIKLYVDNILLNTIDLTRTINKDREGTNPFHEPHYIILNLAIGGTNGGDPSKTEFPARFEVDYVRVYQKVSMSRTTRESG